MHNLIETDFFTPEYLNKNPTFKIGDKVNYKSRKPGSKKVVVYKPVTIQAVTKIDNAYARRIGWYWDRKVTFQEGMKIFPDGHCYDILFDPKIQNQPSVEEPIYSENTSTSPDIDDHTYNTIHKIEPTYDYKIGVSSKRLTKIPTQGGRKRRQTKRAPKQMKKRPNARSNRWH